MVPATPPPGVRNSLPVSVRHILFVTLTLAALPVAHGEDAAEFEAFRKQIEGQLATMKATYEGRIKQLESRINTLESDNSKLRGQTAPRALPAQTAELENMKKRLGELETLAGRAAPEFRAASERSVANAEAIDEIERKLAASATETRDIYRDSGAWPFDAAKLYDLPRPFEYHGYLRSGFGMNGEGGKMEAFRAPGAGAKYRLGNEADTYGEIGLTHNWLREDDPLASPYVRATAMLSYSTGENFSYDSLNRTDLGNDIALRQAFVEAGNVFRDTPEIRFWAGQRYYRRHDIHINDFYYLDMSGYGGGVEDVPLGSFGKVALAWLGGSVDGYITDNGDVAKQNFDLRLYDVKVPFGKATFWFDYANTKGGEVRNVFDEEGNDFNIQSSGGWAVGFIHRTEEEKLLGGYNEFSIQYGEGAAYNFASTLDASGPDLDSASRFRVTDHITMQPWKHFSAQLVGVYEETKYGGPYSTERWASLGARPIYHFNDRFSIALEGGIDWASSQALDTDGHLWKITLAPQLSRGGKFFSRPVLRAFLTYARWSEDFKGRVGGDAYENATEGWSYGLQAEAWW
ncbi:MAG: carbohydrate porin [Chthoniobacteraceae bacterium]